MSTKFLNAKRADGTPCAVRVDGNMPTSTGMEGPIPVGGFAAARYTLDGKSLNPTSDPKVFELRGGERVTLD